MEQNNDRPVLDTSPERQAFEQWMQERFPSAPLYRRDAKGSLRLGQYCSSAVEDQWETWKARGAVLASSASDKQDMLPQALWTRRGSGTSEWWSYKGYEARKDGAEQWVLRRAGIELYRHTYLQVVMAHAERAILAAAPNPSDKQEAVTRKTSNQHRGGTEAYKATEHYNEGWNDCLSAIAIPLGKSASDALTYPKELTADLREVLGWPCFKCAPIAHAMRAGGDNIKPKAEDEQAVVLHWLVTLVLTHGDGWRAEAQKEIVRLRDAAIAKEKQG